METLGGVLIFWRRTTTLGALISIAVMSNVVMLNFCYDVPVKLYSAHILLMEGFLVLPDARRLLDVLLFNRPTAARAFAPSVLSPRWRIARNVAKYVFLLTLVDEKTKAISFTKPQGTGVPDTLAGSRPDDEHLVLEGKLGGDALVVKLKKLPLPEFQLTTRGFHWIQEFPYNR